MSYFPNNIETRKSLFVPEGGGLDDAEVRKPLWVKG